MMCDWLSGCVVADVAFTLCQVGPVLADNDNSSDVREKVQRDFLEKMILRHEEGGGKESDDDIWLEIAVQINLGFFTNQEITLS